MSQSNFPKEVDLLSLVNGGVSYPEGGGMNYLTSATKAMETAIGEEPLAAPGAGYTMQSSLLEQFSEFLRIECGEVLWKVRGQPLTDPLVNTSAAGQNNANAYFPDSMNSSDYFNNTGHMIPTIRYRNPRMFVDADGDPIPDTKFFSHVTVVTRMSGQDDWASQQNSSGNAILGNLPEPYDYPLTIGVCSSAGETGINVWLVLGDNPSGGGWNSHENSTFMINPGQELMIRYCVFQVGWLG